MDVPISCPRCGNTDFIHGRSDETCTACGETFDRDKLTEKFVDANSKNLTELAVKEFQKHFR